MLRRSLERTRAREEPSNDTLESPDHCRFPTRVHSPALSPTRLTVTVGSAASRPTGPRQRRSARHASPRAQPHYDQVFGDDVFG